MSKQYPSFGWLQENFKSKSAAIRYMLHEEFEVKEIADYLGFKYQHVYNVKTKMEKDRSNTKCCPVCKGRN